MHVMADRLVQATNCSGRQHHGGAASTGSPPRHVESPGSHFASARQAAIPPGYLVAPLYEMSLQGPSFVTIPKGDYRD